MASEAPARTGLYSLDSVIASGGNFRLGELAILDLVSVATRVFRAFESIRLLPLGI